MFYVICYTGILGRTSTFKDASSLWQNWCQFFHNKAQSTHGTKDYNHWVKCFNTLKVEEQQY